jgi:putative endonuclease
MPPSKQTGARGEAIARQYLRQQGYRIIAANWSSVFGELDIVAARDGTLAFVEVKTRRAANTESALAGITAAKRERMLKAVYQYLHDEELDPDTQWRIDVIAVALDGGRPPMLDHVEDAFDW